MPRKRTRVTKVVEYSMDLQTLLDVLYDLELYKRFPSLAPFRAKVIRLWSRALQVAAERVRDSRLRKWYSDIVEEFKEALWDLQDAPRSLEGFPAFMKERHNVEAECFVCYSHQRRIALM